MPVRRSGYRTQLAPALYSNHAFIVVKKWNCAENSPHRNGQRLNGLRRIGQHRIVSAPNLPRWIGRAETAASKSLPPQIKFWFMDQF